MGETTDPLMDVSGESWRNYIIRYVGAHCPLAPPPLLLEDLQIRRQGELVSEGRSASREGRVLPSTKEATLSASLFATLEIQFTEQIP